MVIRAGSTNARWWEIEQASQLVAPERLVILAPAEKYEYETFRSRLEKIVKHPLPTEGASKPLHIQSRLWWILSFERDSTPRLTGLQRGVVPGILRALYGLEHQFKHALRPIFHRLNIKPAPMRWRAGWAWLGGLTPAVLVIAYMTISPMRSLNHFIGDTSTTREEFYDGFRKRCVGLAHDQVEPQAKAYCDCLVIQAKGKNLASRGAGVDPSSQEGQQILWEIKQPCVDKSEHESARFYDALRENCVGSDPDEVKDQAEKINTYCDCVMTQAKAKKFWSTMPAVSPSSQQSQQMLDEVQQKWDEIMQPCAAQLQQ